MSVASNKIAPAGERPRKRSGNPNPVNNGRGRPKGASNKVTTILKEAVIAAAVAEGMDQKGKDGLRGYCRMLARAEKKAFAVLLGKVLPTQITGEDGKAITINVNGKDADLL